MGGGKLGVGLVNWWVVVYCGLNWLGRGGLGWGFGKLGGGGLVNWGGGGVKWGGGQLVNRGGGGGFGELGGGGGGLVNWGWGFGKLGGGGFGKLGVGWEVCLGKKTVKRSVKLRRIRKSIETKKYKFFSEM